MHEWVFLKNANNNASQVNNLVNIGYNLLLGSHSFTMFRFVKPNSWNRSDDFEKILRLLVKSRFRCYLYIFPGTENLIPEPSALKKMLLSVAKMKMSKVAMTVHFLPSDEASFSRQYDSPCVDCVVKRNECCNTYADYCATEMCHSSVNAEALMRTKRFYWRDIRRVSSNDRYPFYFSHSKRSELSYDLWRKHWRFDLPSQISYVIPIWVRDFASMKYAEWRWRKLAKTT